MRATVTTIASALIAFAFTAAAATAANPAVSGSFSREGRETVITDVSVERLDPSGADEPAWRLVFSEQPHEHSPAGRARALDGEHGLAFTVEVLASGEGHLFVLYAREPGATSAYPSSFPWPTVGGFSTDAGIVSGLVSHNRDFPFGGMVFDLEFSAPSSGE